MLILLIAVLLLGAISFGAVRASRASNQSQLIEVIEIEPRDITVKIPANGMLEEVEKELVYYEGNGKVDTVEVEIGDVVQKGQVLAKLETTDLGNKLSIAYLQLEIEELNIAKLEKTRTETIENTLRSLDNAKNILERNLVLYQSGALSQIELEKSQETYDELARNYEQFLNEEDSLLFDIQRLRKQLEVSQLNIQDLKREQERLGGKILSPMNGIVTAVNTQKGSIVNPATPSFIISNINDLEIKIFVNEYDIAKVQLGQGVEIVTDALSGKIFSGIVDKIAPVATRMATGQSTETVVAVTIKVVESHEMLKPGFSVKTKIISDKKEATIVLPFDAIKLEQDGRKIVYVVEGEVAIAREVQTGIESDFDVEIIEGLKLGDLVILRPGANIKDGERVIIRQQK